MAQYNYKSCLGFDTASRIQAMKRSGKTNSSQSALFEKNKIWRQGSSGTVYVTFKDSTSSWAYTGNSGNNPSMNLGFIDPPLGDFTFNDVTYKYSDFKCATRNGCTDCNNGVMRCPNTWTPGATVIHEFCHVLGMDHEHQNNLRNSNKLKLNIPNILKTYKGDYDKAYTNVIEWYDCKDPEKCAYIGSDYDPDSIMLYQFEDDWVIGPNPTKANYKLSKTDITWLQSMYPKGLTKSYPQLNIRFVDSNAPMWKKAWVMKVTTEQIFPLLGVKATFYDSSSKLLYVYCSDCVDKPTKSPIESTKNPTTSPPSPTSTEKSTESTQSTESTPQLFCDRVICNYDAKSKCSGISCSKDVCNGSCNTTCTQFCYKNKDELLKNAVKDTSGVLKNAGSGLMCTDVSCALKDCQGTTINKQETTDRIIYSGFCSSTCSQKCSRSPSSSSRALKENFTDISNMSVKKKVLLSLVIISVIIILFLLFMAYII